MCLGKTHTDWYCCLNFLISILSSPHTSISSDLLRFLRAGLQNTIMARFKGHPPLTPMPSLVIQVIRDISGNETYEHMTEVMYFAFDPQAGPAAGTWFEIEEERWVTMRRFMRIDETVPGRCEEHEIGSTFVVWRIHELSKMRERGDGGGKVAFSASSRKERRDCQVSQWEKRGKGGRTMGA